MTSKILRFGGGNEGPENTPAEEVSDEQRIIDARKGKIDELQLGILRNHELYTHEISQEIERIRGIIESTWWRSYGETGVFSLDQSIADLSEALGMEPSLVRDCIRESVTPECLVKISQNPESGRPLVEELDVNNFEVYCLLGVLKEEGFSMFAWTLGDEEWQREKFRRSGAGNFIDSNHLFVEEGTEKISKLKEILDRILSERSDSPVHVYVVDDNQKNIDDAMGLSSEYESKGIELHNYHLKLDDPNADGTAFYNYMIEERKKYPNLVLVLDFDQVIANTNGALFGSACENILKEKIKARIPKKPQEILEKKVA